MFAHWLGAARSGLASRPLLAALAANTGWLLGEKILRLAVGLIVGALTVRYLGPEQFGLLSYALAFVTLVSVLANLGLDAIVVRDIARNPHARDAILGSAFVLRAAGALVAVGGAAAAGALLDTAAPGLRLLAFVTALSLVFQALDPIDVWFKSQLRARVAVIARNAAFVIASGARLLLIWAEAPLLGFAFMITAEAALSALALLIAYRTEGNRLRDWRPDYPMMRELARQGWPLMLAGLMVSLYMRIDQVMLGQMAGTQALGLYSAAVLLSEPLHFVPMAIVASAAPVLAHWHRSDPALFHARMEELFRVLLLIAAAMALPISLLSRPLAELLFGPEFRDAGPVLAVHVWSSVFVALGVASSQYLVLEDLTRVSAQRTLVGAALNIMLNFFWIPAYGALGCAWATLISYATASLFLFHTPSSRRCLALMARALRPRRRPA